MMELLRPGMGTENALELIASLIKMIRPTAVLEIGAGDSTIAIARALSQASKSHEEDKKLVLSSEWSERSELLIPAIALENYNPYFVSVDNFSADGCSASEAWGAVNQYSNVTIEKKNIDFFEIPAQFFENNRFDFVWIDAGALADDVRFIGKIWRHLNDGAILCLHEPYFTACVKQNEEERLALVRTPLWERILRSELQNVDILSVPEVHKYRQSGIGIIRKRNSWESKFRTSSFQEEMVSVGEAPVRFAVTGMVVEKKSPTKNFACLSKDKVRKVFFAISAGCGSINRIMEVTCLGVTDIQIAISKLLDSGLIENLNDELIERKSNIEDWTRLFSKFSEPDMTDKALEHPDVLELIVNGLHSGDFTEREISDYCALFTEDFARLRRRLVDSKCLARRDNIYKK